MVGRPQALFWPLYFEFAHELRLLSGPGRAALAPVQHAVLGASLLRARSSANDSLPVLLNPGKGVNETGWRYMLGGGVAYHNLGRVRGAGCCPREEIERGSRAPCSFFS